MEPTYVRPADIREGLRRLLPFAELLAEEYPGRPSDAAAVQAVVSREQ